MLMVAILKYGTVADTSAGASHTLYLDINRDRAVDSIGLCCDRRSLRPRIDS